ncbi:YoaK family protein [Streptomyces sp. NPDC091280]|uniref:YoaK family protein n=1 Tax=unclassified Streptomyces TaxID=2593676 RepID=UPI0037F98EC8
MDQNTQPKSYDREARGVRLVAVLLGLTMVSGLIDAASYLGLGHVFTANMTGNVVVLGFAAAGAPGFSVSRTLTSLGAFLVGAAVGGRIAVRMDTGSRRKWARVSLGAEALLVGVAAVIAWAAPGDSATTHPLIALTAFAMGLRNAAVRKLKVTSFSTTTVLTMTLTGLVADTVAGERWGPAAFRRLSAALSMAGGACVGAWLVLHHDLRYPLLLAALVAGAFAVIASGRE